MKVTVLEHIEAIIEANDRRYSDLRDAQDKAIQAALASQEKAVAAALAAQEKAVTVAEVNAEKWRMNANEWRASMLDRERNFLSKSVGYIIGFLTIASLVAAFITNVVKGI